MIVDLDAGTAIIRGPSTKEQKAEWDKGVERKRDFEQQLQELQAMLRDPDCVARAIVEDDVEHTKRLLGIFARVVINGAPLP